MFLKGSLGSYLVSLLLPAVPGYPGWATLILGIFPCFATVANATWFANAPLVVAWICVKTGERRVALVTSACSVLVAGTLPFCHRILTDESGTPRPFSPQFGYWVWLLSMLLALVAAFFCPFEENGARRSPSPEPPDAAH